MSWWRSRAVLSTNLLKYLLLTLLLKVGIKPPVPLSIWLLRVGKPDDWRGVKTGGTNRICPSLGVASTKQLICRDTDRVNLFLGIPKCAGAGDCLPLLV